LGARVAVFDGIAENEEIFEIQQRLAPDARHSPLAIVEAGQIGDGGGLPVPIFECVHPVRENKLILRVLGHHGIIGRSLQRNRPRYVAEHVVLRVICVNVGGGNR